MKLLTEKEAWMALALYYARCIEHGDAGYGWPGLGICMGIGTLRYNGDISDRTYLVLRTKLHWTLVRYAWLTGTRQGTVSRLLFCAKQAGIKVPR